MIIKFLDAVSTLPIQSEPITLEEITNLELKYNGGISFPDSLRELLFLAGNFCQPLEFGLSNSQDELQSEVRDWLLQAEETISRPFYVIETYNTDGFVLVYLDEGKTDPTVFSVMLGNHTGLEVPGRSLGKALSEYINLKVDRVRIGLSSS
jgi:hypothetical protein